MRIWAASFLVLAASVALATGTAADIDYSDFDDALMRDMDDAIKELDSNVGGQDAPASRANVEVLREGLVWAEKYFAAKPETPRGAELAREGQQQLAQVSQAIEAGNFDAASDSVRGVVRSCKACHEAYRPPE
jgi:cytochrome c556